MPLFVRIAFGCWIFIREMFLFRSGVGGKSNCRGKWSRLLKHCEPYRDFSFLCFLLGPAPIWHIIYCILSHSNNLRVSRIRYLPAMVYATTRTITPTLLNRKASKPRTVDRTREARRRRLRRAIMPSRRSACAALLVAALYAIVTPWNNWCHFYYTVASSYRSDGRWHLW